jgi:LmbE family N-acetylglucosaminyl deacetylase
MSAVSNPHVRPHDLGSILSIWAHPDDETYLAGGIMATAAGNGQRVVCVSATAGEHGTDDPERWPPDVLGPLRRDEARAAMSVLGVADHRFLGYEDSTLASLDDQGPVAAICELIDEVRPDTVLTFGFDGMTFHPDHQAVARWVVAALARTGSHSQLFQAVWPTSWLSQWLPLYEEWGIFMTDERPTGTPDDSIELMLVLPPHLLDRKVAALLAMPSQVAATIEAMGIEVFRAESAIESFVRFDPAS